MEPKFEVGDSVVVWPTREVESAMAKTMSKYIGKTFRITALYTSPDCRNSIYPPYFYKLDWDRIPPTAYEDWLDYHSTVGKIDRSQLIALL